MNQDTEGADLMVGVGGHLKLARPVGVIAWMPDEFQGPGANVAIKCHSEIHRALGMGKILCQALRMAQIKFGTDGWRAVIAEDFAFANVALADLEV